MAAHLTTNDIGILIRDHIEGHPNVEAFDWTPGGEASYLHNECSIEHVDASDASNLIVVVDDGHRFRVTITRID